METVSLFLLLLIIDLIPVTYAPMFHSPYEGGKFFLFVILSGLLLIVRGLKRLGHNGHADAIPTKSTLVAIMVFTATIGISTITSVHPLTSLLGAYGSFTGGLLYSFLLLILYATTLYFQKEAKLLLQTIVFTGLVVSVWGLWQYLTQGLVYGDMFFRIASLSGQPNRLAFYLLAILPVGWILYHHEKSPLWRLLYVGGFGATLLTLLLTYSRTTYVSLLLLIGLSVFFERKKVQKNLKRLTFFPALPALLAILVLLAFGLHIARTLPGAFQKSAQSSVYLRIAELEAAVSDIRSRDIVRTLVGNGPDTAYFTFFRHRPAIFNESNEEFSVGPTQYRNHYIQLLSTIGLLGLAAYLFLYYQFLEAAHKQKGAVSEVAFYGLLAIAINSFFYYQPESVLALFWLFGGLVTPRKQPTKKSGSRLLSVAIVTVGIVFLYGAGRGILAEWYAENDQNLSHAHKLNPLYDTYSRRLSQVVLSQALSEKETNHEAAKRDLTEAIVWANQSYTINPLDVRNVRQLVISQYHMGVLFDKIYQQKNISLAQTLPVLSPTDPRSWDLLGLVYLNLGNLASAKENFEKERVLVPYSPTPYLHLGEVAKQQGNIKEAISLIQQAVKLSPGWDFAVKELEKAKALLLPSP